jgi:hypothetical protein
LAASLEELRMGRLGELGSERSVRFLLLVSISIGSFDRAKEAEKMSVCDTIGRSSSTAAEGEAEGEEEEAAAVAAAAAAAVAAAAAAAGRGGRGGLRAGPVGREEEANLAGASVLLDSSTF